MSVTALKDPRLDLIIRGGKRIYGEGAKAIRYPITYDILLRMVNEIRDDEEGVNVKAALCVGFAAFLHGIHGPQTPTASSSYVVMLPSTPR
jgi:hypothetical protein